MTGTHRRSLLFLVAFLMGLAPRVLVAQGSADAYLAFLSALQFERHDDRDGALAALERAAKADPASAEIRAQIASVHISREALVDAEAEAKAALALDANNVRANRILGLIYVSYLEDRGRSDSPAKAAGYLRDAITYLEKAAGDTPATADLTLHYTLGRLYILNGESTKAIESLTRVLTQNPGSVQGRLTLAQAYAAAGSLEGAIGTLEEVVESEPRVAAALGQYQEQAGLYAEAVNSYTLALAVQPRSRELKVRRLAALLETGEYDRAAGFAADARRQHPDDSRFLRLQARAMFAGGNRSGAISLLEQGVRDNPSDTGTLYSLADAYADSSRSRDAERVLRQILAAEPANANALNYLGYLLALRGEQLDEAIDLVGRALAAEPDNGAYLDSLGWAHFKRGDLEDAERYLSAAAERLPENSEIQDHLGDLFARQGRLQDAIDAWTRALDGDGQDVDREIVESKIRDARGRMKNVK